MIASKNIFNDAYLFLDKPSTQHTLIHFFFFYFILLFFFIII